MVTGEVLVFRSHTLGGKGVKPLTLCAHFMNNFPAKNQIELGQQNDLPIFPKTEAQRLLVLLFLTTLGSLSTSLSPKRRTIFPFSNKKQVKVFRSR
jgi:hypothetical protein